MKHVFVLEIESSDERETAPRRIERLVRQALEREFPRDATFLERKFKKDAVVVYHASSR